MSQAVQEPQQQSQDVEILLTPRQGLAYGLITNPDDVALMYGGAKGGGKSFLESLWVYMWCRHLIDLFGLKYNEARPEPPLAVGFWGRQVAAHFGSTTLETFKRTIPSCLYRLRSDKVGGNYIEFFRLVKVYYGGLDNRQRLEKFNSAEFAFIALGQAEETERADVQVLRAALRLKHNGITPPYKELYTTNPAECWLKSDFIDDVRPGHHYVPALPSDNPHLPPSYIPRLKEIFRHNKALLAAYLEGDWTALKASNALISTEMLNELKKVNRYFKDVRRAVVCDPSLGGDECVIYVMENYKIVDEVILHNEHDGMIVAGHMVLLSNKWLTNNFGADTTGGLGSVILDRVRELKKGSRCFYINSSEKADNEERSTNVRGELWWDGMTKVQDKRIPFPEDEKLRSQLVAGRFKLMNSDGQIQMEPKTETKKRTGGDSPDRADAFLLGLRVMDRVEPITKQDGWESERGSQAIGGGAKSAMAG